MATTASSFSFKEKYMLWWEGHTHTNTNTYTHTSSGAGERDTDTHTYIYTHKYKYIYTHKLVVRASIGTMTNEPTRVLYGAVISFRQPADLPVLVLREHVDNAHKYRLAAVLCCGTDVQN